LVVLALYWWKREELIAASAPACGRRACSWSPPGLCAHLLGYIVQQPRLSAHRFFTGLYGLTGLAWGKIGLKASFFPFFLLAFCVPAGGTDWLTLRLCA